MRRVQVEGDLMLFGVDYPNPDAGYASGGYMADSYVTGTLNAGSQQ